MFSEKQVQHLTATKSEKLNSLKYMVSIILPNDIFSKNYSTVGHICLRTSST